MFKFMKKFFLRYKLSLGVFILINIIISVITFLLTIINGEIINVLLEKSVNTLYTYCIVIAVLTVISTTFNYSLIMINAKLQNSVSYDIIINILSYMKKLPYEFFTHKDSSYLSQRINNDAGALAVFFLDIISNSLINIINIILILVFLIRASYKIAIISMLLVGIYLAVYIFLRKDILKKGRTFQDLMAQFFSKINELISNMQFIKIHEAGFNFDNRINLVYKKMYKSSLIYNKAGFIYSSYETLITTIAKMIIFIIAGLDVINGNLSVGYFSILISFFNSILNSVKYFFNIGKKYQDTLVSYERVKEILNCQQQEDGSILIETINKIAIEDLTFHYGTTKLFEKLNLELVKGNIYGIKGTNGSGKTTFSKLLIGLFNNEYIGTVKYNDINIKSLNMPIIREKSICFIEQTPILTNDTIYNNLFLTNNDPKTDGSNVNYYIKFLNLNEFISKTPNGLDTVIDSQIGNLSGGERQKISIIRELLKDADLLIFDEPTSAMDTFSKKQFYMLLQNIKKEKIVIVITHDKDIHEYSDLVIDF